MVLPPYVVLPPRMPSCMESKIKVDSVGKLMLMVNFGGII